MSVITLTEQNFETEVLQSDVPVLVDFWATWCGPCKMQGPIIEELAGETEGVKFGKLDVDENMSLAVKYGVSSIPTLIVFRGGEAVNTAIGLRPKEAVLQMLGL